MTAVSIILQSILGMMFTFLGIASLSGAQSQMKNFEHLHLPNWFRYITGVVQMIGGIMILIGIWINELTIYSSLLLTVMMVVAALLHIKEKDPISGVAPPIIVGIISFSVFLLNYIS